MSNPPRTIKLTTLLLSLVIILLSGCDSRSRHKTLNFFFTGVPPLEESAESIEENTGQEQMEKKHQAAAVEIRSAHSYFTQKKCVKCHQSTRSIVSGGHSRASRELATDTGKPVGPIVPYELGICLNCHDNPFEKKKPDEPRRHAPVSCSACHLPHQSEYPYLLKSEASAICAMCHQDENHSGKGFHKTPLKSDKSE